MAQFVFSNNTAIIGISPFYANYGKHPNISRDLRRTKPIAEKANISMERLKELYILL